MPTDLFFLANDVGLPIRTSSAHLWTEGTIPNIVDMVAVSPQQAHAIFSDKFMRDLVIRGSCNVNIDYHQRSESSILEDNCYLRRRERYDYSAFGDPSFEVRLRRLVGCYGIRGGLISLSDYAITVESEDTVGETTYTEFFYERGQCAPGGDCSGTDTDENENSNDAGPMSVERTDLALPMFQFFQDEGQLYLYAYIKFNFNLELSDIGSSRDAWALITSKASVPGARTGSIALSMPAYATSLTLPVYYSDDSRTHDMDDGSFSSGAVCEPGDSNSVNQDLGVDDFRPTISELFIEQGDE